MSIKVAVDKISDISDCLKGLSGLFTISGEEVSLSSSELYGLGRLVEKLGSNLIEINDELRESMESST
jgi:hypothetical protein